MVDTETPSDQKQLKNGLKHRQNGKSNGFLTSNGHIKVFLFVINYVFVVV